MKVKEKIGNETLAVRPRIIHSTGESLAPKSTYREVITYDENGEVISDLTARVSRKNGRGFVLSYTSKMDELIKRIPSLASLKIFMLIAHHQGYGVDGVFGFRCTRQYLADTLGLTRKTVYTSLEYLIENFLVNEIRVAGVLEYMVNPDYVTIGADKKLRQKEWSERWEFYWKRKHDIITRRENFKGGKHEEQGILQGSQSSC